jgi:citrate synthase
MTHSVKTQISTITEEGLVIKGRFLEDLIGSASFGDMVYLLMTGKLPEGEQGQMVEAMLVSCVDHGLNAPSVHVTRTVASCGVPVSTAVAAGISAIGEHHGGAGEACGRMLSDALTSSAERDPRVLAETIVRDYRTDGRKLPGFGHRIYKKADPRAEKLLSLADAWDLSRTAVTLLRAIQTTWKDITGKHLSINIDGAQGAILVDMGIPWQQAKGMFLIGRTAGLNAHAVEQIETGKPFKFAAPVNAQYSGPMPEAHSED